MALESHSAEIIRRPGLPKAWLPLTPRAWPRQTASPNQGGPPNEPQPRLARTGHARVGLSDTPAW